MIQETCNIFRSDNFEEIFIYAESSSRFNWIGTWFENHSLCRVWLKAFAALFTLISGFWNLFVRLNGTITTSHLFCEQSSFNVLSWPLKVSITTCKHYSSGYLCSILTLSRYKKMISSKNLVHFSVFDKWFSVQVTEKKFGNLNFGKECLIFAL